MKRSRLKVTDIAIAAALFLAEGVYAQPAMRLSLEQAISLSLQNSGKLKIANAKVEEAVAASHEARDHRLPDVKMSGSYLRLNNPTVDLKVKTGSGTGGGDMKVEQAVYGMANVSMPLFAGFKIKRGIESARFLEQATRLDAEKDHDEVVQNAIGAYCNLYKAKRSVELVKETLEREEQRVKDFSDLEKNGLLARNDLLKAQLQQSNVELALLEAESNLKMTTVNMALLLGLPEGTALTPDSTSIEPVTDAGTLTKWEDAALVQRKDRAALNARIGATNASIMAMKGDYYPALAITGGYIAADVPNLLTLTNAVNLGLGLQYNLGSIWKTGAKIDAAKARLHQAQATEGILADQIRLEVNNAYQQYLLSLKKITVYQKSVEQTNENYRITKNKYDNNLVTTTELLDADVAQLQAKLNYAFSKADALVAYKKLQQVTGMLK
jgi:outer membrane protein TolC